MFYRRLGEWILSHRWPILMGSIFLSLLSLTQWGKLKFDFSPTAMLQFDAEEEAYQKTFEERYGSSEDYLLIVLKGKKGIFQTAYGLSYLAYLTDLAARDPLAKGVYSLSRVPIPQKLRRPFWKNNGKWTQPMIDHWPIGEKEAQAIRKRIQNSQLIVNRLVSKDGSAALIIVALDPSMRNLEKLSPLLKDFQKSIKDAKPSFFKSNPAQHIEIAWGGLPYVRVETVRNLKGVQLMYWPIVGGIFFLLLWLLFRNPLIGALPLIAVGLATFWVVGGLAAMGQEVNIINNIMPTMILIVGICDGVHLMMHFLEQRREGQNAWNAAKSSIAALGLPCFLTTLTTAIGFLALILAKSEVLRNFGWEIGLGLLLTYLSIIVVIPILASFTQTVPKLSPNTWIQKFKDLLDHSLEKWALWSIRHPKKIVLFGLGLTALSIWSGQNVRVDSRAADAFQKGDPIFETNQLIEEKLGGVLPLEIELTGPTPNYFERPEGLEVLARIEAQVGEKDGVIQTLSVVDLLKEAGLALGMKAEFPRDLVGLIPLFKQTSPEQWKAYVSKHGVRLTAMIKDHGIEKTLKVIHAIEKMDDPWHGQITLRQTGAAYLSAKGLDVFVQSLLMSLMVATLVIFLTLVIAFHSWRMGWISLLPNILPLALTLALMPYLGYELNTTSVVVFTISIGLAVDNSIHLMSKFAALKTKPFEESIVETFRHTGKAVIFSNLFLIVGFSILSTSHFEPTQRVSILTMITIISALLAALLFLPSLFYLFGPKSDFLKASKDP